MEHTPNDTGYKDKSGRKIYVGDILQHRLGKFGKTGGATNLRVIMFGKQYHAVGESQDDTKYGGTPLTERFCEDVVVVESDHLAD